MNSFKFFYDDDDDDSHSIRSVYAWDSTHNLYLLSFL